MRNYTVTGQIIVAESLDLTFSATSEEDARAQAVRYVERRFANVSEIKIENVRKLAE